ncbi:MAG: hypothetical protein ACKOXK_03315 [Chakrabartia sp.]
MSTRIFNAGLIIFMVAGCDKAPAGDAIPPGAPRIACAVSGAPMAKLCGLERQATPAGPVLVLRHPDGGFRRLQIVTDGRGVIAADGAQPAKVRLRGADEIEVQIEGDIYRLPAKAKTPTPA